MNISASAAVSGTVKAHCVRVEPGEDLGPALLSAAKHAIQQSSASQAAFIMTAVGSVSSVTLRMANATQSPDDEPVNDVRTWTECMEVVSLVGTFAGDEDTSKHLHMSVADAQGRVYGGHFVGATVFTTLELVVGTVDGVSFEREFDERTGYRELVIRPTPSSEAPQTT